jgi:hypothetical protein
MTSGWIQVTCPVCHVDQPARLRFKLGETDHTANAVAVSVEADMTNVNAHVEACKRGHGQ